MDTITSTQMNSCLILSILLFCLVWVKFAWKTVHGDPADFIPYTYKHICMLYLYFIKHQLCLTNMVKLHLIYINTFKKVVIYTKHSTSKGLKLVLYISHPVGIVIKTLSHPYPISCSHDLSQNVCGIGYNTLLCWCLVML